MPAKKKSKIKSVSSKTWTVVPGCLCLHCRINRPHTHSVPFTFKTNKTTRACDICSHKEVLSTTNGVTN